MEQLQVAWAFVWKYRFWFGVGLSALFGFITYYVGTSGLAEQAKQKQSQLEGTYNQVKTYTSKSDQPNGRWITMAEEEEKKIGGISDEIHAQLYKAQEHLFTWPANVSERFSGREFGALLDDNQNAWLIIYYREGYATQTQFIFDQLGALEMDKEGNVYGTLVADPKLMKTASFKSGVAPSSREAWIIQEDLWIQRGIFKTIAMTNSRAKKNPNDASEPLRWRDAWIKGVLDVGFCGSAKLDSKTETAKPPLVPAWDGDTTGGNRYLERNEQFRVIPVSMTLLVDQDKIPEIVAGLCEGELEFTVLQINMLMPDSRVEVPQLLQEESNRLGTVSPVSSRDPWIFNTVRMNVWGQMRIYNMPAAVKAEAAKKAEAMRAGAPVGLPAQGQQPTPPAQGQPLNAQPTTPNPPGGNQTPPAMDKSGAKQPDAKGADGKQPDAKQADAKGSTPPVKGDVKTPPNDKKEPDSKAGDKKESDKKEPPKEAGKGGSPPTANPPVTKDSKQPPPPAEKKK